MRIVEFANEEFYHIYNRGTDKRFTFLTDIDRKRFIRSLDSFNRTKRSSQSLSKNLRNRKSTPEPIVEIHGFCLMGNHYHLLLRQLVDGGVSKFMHSLSMGYTKYFNKKYNRSGNLFESAYKIKHVDTTGYLLQVSAYIHCNPFELTTKNHRTFMERYRWSSFGQYLHGSGYPFVATDFILGHFVDEQDYKTFVFEKLDAHLFTDIDYVTR